MLTNKYNNMNIWTLHFHYTATAIHIFAGVFWLGWMFFLFVILRPVAAKITSGNPGKIMKPIQKRVRKIVFWIIPILLITGLYNMGYRGLLDWSILTGTPMGHRMLWKLGAAAILFAVYYLAPFITGGKSKGKDGDCHSTPNPMAKKVTVLLHVVAFSAGVTAAYLGITLDG